jgi:hypothetical protein
VKRRGREKLIANQQWVCRAHVHLFFSLPLSFSRERALSRVESPSRFLHASFRGQTGVSLTHIILKNLFRFMRSRRYARYS